MILLINKRPYLGGHLDKSSCYQRMLGVLLVLFGRTYFHFLNDGSGRMLYSFLHRNEATGNCASGFVDCFCHVCLSCSFQAL